MNPIKTYILLILMGTLGAQADVTFNFSYEQELPAEAVKKIEAAGKKVGSWLDHDAEVNVLIQATQKMTPHPSLSNADHDLFRDKGVSLLVRNDLSNFSYTRVGNKILHGMGNEAGEPEVRIILNLGKHQCFIDEAGEHSGEYKIEESIAMALTHSLGLGSVFIECATWEELYKEKGYAMALVDLLALAEDRYLPHGWLLPKSIPHSRFDRHLEGSNGNALYDQYGDIKDWSVCAHRDEIYFAGKYTDKAAELYFKKYCKDDEYCPVDTCARGKFRLRLPEAHFIRAVELREGKEPYKLATPEWDLLTTGILMDLGYKIKNEAAREIRASI